MRFDCAVLVVTVLAACDLQGPTGPKGDPGTPGTSTPTTGTAEVSGKVILSGLADHSGASVVLLGPTSGGAVTGPDGSFTFTALPAGTYTVIGSARSTTEAVVSRSVTVGEHASATVEDLIFAPLGALSGTAQLGGQATGNGGIAVRVVGTGLGAFTDDAGRYVINGVMSGLVDVQAEHAGYTLATGQVTAVYGVETTVPTLNLAPSAATSGNCVIRGVATLIGKTDHSGTQVRIGAPANLSTTTATDGSFELTGVPEGVYVMTLANGPYQETVPAVFADSLGSGAVWNGVTYAPLAPIELARGTRLLSGKVLASVSPDGAVIAAARLLDPVSNLAEVVVFSSSGLAGRVVTNRAYFFRPQFTGDGSKVVFLAPSPEAQANPPVLMVVPVAGGAPVVGARNVSAGDGTFAIDGEKVLFIRANTEGDLYTGPIDGTDAALLVGGCAKPGEFLAVDGGTKVLFTQSFATAPACGTNYTSLSVKPRTGGAATWLTDWGWGSTRVAPDRLKVAYQRGSSYFVRTLASGAEITAPTGSSTTLGFTRDSQYVFLSMSPPTIALLPVSGGELVGVAGDASGPVASSPDGSKVAYGSASAWVLRVADLTASTNVKIAEGPWSVSRLATSAFDSSGSRLWYAGAPDPQYACSEPSLIASMADGTGQESLLRCMGNTDGWAGSRVVAARTTAFPPYEFQAGLYLLSAP